MTNIPASLLFLFLLLVVSTSSATAASSRGGLKGLKGVKNQHRNLKGGDKDGDDKDNDKDKDDGSDIDVDDIVGLGCFSGESTVIVEDHAWSPGAAAGYTPVVVEMKDLQIGDRVLTEDGSYQPVYAFGHYLPNEKDVVFVQLETEDGDHLQLTPEHLVFRRQEDDVTKMKKAPVRADSIQPGDVLVSVSGSGGATKVIGTSIIKGEGLYAPLTPKGTIVVDGIVASSYVSLQQEHSSEMIQLNGWTFMSQHKFVHMSLSPLRMACLGISSKFCQGPDGNNDNNDTTNGMPSYVYWSIRFQRFMEESQNIYVQLFVLGLYTAFISLCMTIESIFGGPTEAPSAIVFLGLMYIIVYRIMRLSVRVKIVLPSHTTTTGGATGAIGNY